MNTCYHFDSKEQAMAKVLIRDLDDRTVARLKERAARNGRSLQAELHTIVERAAMIESIEGRALAARIRRKLGNRKHSDSTSSVVDDRQR
jgi:plasmid stability protein